MDKMQAPKIPIRIAISSERYETAGSLFELSGDVNESGPTPVSPAEELLMGILADDSDDSSTEQDGPDAYFVKPANPAVLRAMRNRTECDAVEKTEIVTEGHIATLPDSEADAETVVITYKESELTGMEGTTSTITYRTDDAGLVTMLRSGAVRTALTFRAHHRTVCTYDTPYMPFHVGIHALVVDNRLSTDGELVLDYIVEIKGGVAERCTMRVKITPLGVNKYT